MFRSALTLITLAILTSPLLLGGKAFAMPAPDIHTTSVVQHGSHATTPVVWLAAGAAALAVVAIAAALNARQRLSHA